MIIILAMLKSPDQIIAPKLLVVLIRKRLVKIKIDMKRNEAYNADQVSIEALEKKKQMPMLQQSRHLASA